MSDLVENILTNNLVDAKELFEERMNVIAQRKLVEMKKQMQAQLDEVQGGLTPSEIAMRKKAGYKKASDVLGDPAAKRGQPLPTKRKAPPSVKGKKFSSTALNWMTDAGRRRELDARRQEKVSSLEKSDPARAEKVKGALRTAHAADVVKGAKRKVGGAYGVWMQREKPKSVGGHALSLLSKTLSAAGS